MSKTIRVEVTEKHIANGELNTCDKCPWVLAIAAHFPYWRVSVDGVEAIAVPHQILGRGLRPMRAAFPQPVVEWIASFDRGYTVYPVCAELVFNEIQFTRRSSEAQA